MCTHTTGFPPTHEEPVTWTSNLASWTSSSGIWYTCDCQRSRIVDHWCCAIDLGSDLQSWFSQGGWGEGRIEGKTRGGGGYFRLIVRLRCRQTCGLDPDFVRLLWSINDQFQLNVSRIDRFSAELMNCDFTILIYALKMFPFLYFDIPWYANAKTMMIYIDTNILLNTKIIYYFLQDCTGNSHSAHWKINGER